MKDTRPGDYWRPWGLPFACGMAIHSINNLPIRKSRWSGVGEAQLEDEKRYPNNEFVQNAREADFLISLHLFSRAMPVHDRPMKWSYFSGAYARPDGGCVQPHALWAMETDA